MGWLSAKHDLTSRGNNDHCDICLIHYPKNTSEYLSNFRFIPDFLTSDILRDVETLSAVVNDTLCTHLLS